jgi:hypothetical protein
MLGCTSLQSHQSTLWRVFRSGNVYVDARLVADSLYRLSTRCAMVGGSQHFRWLCTLVLDHYTHLILYECMFAFPYKYILCTLHMLNLLLNFIDMELRLHAYLCRRQFRPIRAILRCD